MKTPPKTPTGPVSPGLLFARNVVLVVTAALVFAEIWGIPHLRLSLSYRRIGDARVFDHNRYWSPFGVRSVDRFQFGETLPLIVLLPPVTKPSEAMERGARRWIKSAYRRLRNVGSQDQ